MKNRKRALSLALCVLLLLPQAVGSIYAAELGGQLLTGQMSAGQSQSGSETDKSTDGSELEKPSDNGSEADKPSAGEAETDKPAADSPETDKPSTDGTETDKPTTDGTETDKPTTDGSVTDKPTTDGSETDKPTTDGSETEEPSTSGPAVDIPTTSDSAVEKPETPETPETPVIPPLIPLDKIEQELFELLGKPWDGVTTSAAIQKNDVYQISSAAELAWFAQTVNAFGNKEVCTLSAILTDDINLNDKPWTPIGMVKDYDPLAIYGGTFDGDSHVIKGLSIGSEETPDSEGHVGLFGWVEGAAIKNLTIEGMVYSGGNYNGGFAGYGGNAATKFINCTNRVIVRNTGGYSGGYSGGIIGYLDKGSFVNCVNEADLAQETSHAGGLAGGCWIDVSFVNCENKGNISTTYSNAGGIAGNVGYSATAFTLEKCRNTGDVYAENGTAGGLCGNFTKGTVSDSFSTGKVSGGRTLGGLVGSAGSASYCSINTSFFYNDETPLKLSGSKSVTVKNGFYLEADEYGDSYGGMAQSSNIFSSMEMVYYLNGAEDHHATWGQGTPYPIFADGAGQAVYKVQIVPYAMNSAVTAILSADGADGADAEVTVDGKGSQSIFVSNNSGIKVQFSDEKTMIKVKSADKGELAGSSYSTTVSGSDIVLLYGLEDEFTAATLYWYSPYEDDYELAGEGELRGLSELVNGTTSFGAIDLSGKTISLSGDIVLTKPWTAIGSPDTPFAGSFDGAGHIVSGMLIGTAEAAETKDYQGLFGFSNGEIKGLTVSGSIYGNGNYIGGIVGYTTKSLQKCTFGTESTPGTVAGGDYVGGIAGYTASSTCRDLTNRAKINGTKWVGGLIGYADSSIGYSGTQLSNYGAVTAMGGYAGGLVGYGGASVSIGTNSGSVTGGGSYIGGIAGYAVTLSTVENSGVVSGGGMYTAGLGGYINNRISTSTNSGIVYGNGNYTGGLAGYCKSGVSNGINTGSVKGDGLYTGGITGYVDSTISASASEGDVTGGDYTGGLAGYSTNDITGKSDRLTVTGSVTGKNYTGAIAGCIEGTVKMVSVSETAEVSGEDMTGGLVGQLEGGITASYALQPVTGKNAGCLVGNAIDVSTIENSFYFNEKINLPLIGNGKADIVSSCYLADKETDGGGKTIAQFAAGEVAWTLDGGWNTNKTTYWTQETGQKYPVFGNDPIYQIRFTAVGELPTGNSIVISGGGITPSFTGAAVTTDTALGESMWVFAKRGSLLKLNIELLNSYEMTFTPALDLKAAEDGETVQVLEVSGNANSTYSYAVTVVPTYDWFKNASADKKYVLTTESDLKGLSYLVNGKDLENSGQAAALTFEGESIALGANIDMKSVNWPAIGTAETPFRGTFDGAGYTISGLKISSLESDQGLFGLIDNAAIKNVTVGGIVTASGDYIGGIVGRVLGESRLENVRFGGIEGQQASVAGKQYTGGIAGGAVLTTSGQALNIMSCYNLGSASASGNALGGIVGTVTTTSDSITATVNIKLCENAGTVSGSGQYTGGIIGRSSASSGTLNILLEENKNAGVVKGAGSTGGIAGYIEGNSDSILAVLSKCRNTGTVTATGDSAAGVIGNLYRYAIVEECSNAGNVQGKLKNTGGVAGSAGSSTSIINCWNADSASVEGEGDNTGGVVGTMSSFKTLERCFNAGEVTGNSYVGGVAGYLSSYSDAKVYDNHNDGTVYGSASAGGVVGKLGVKLIAASYNEGDVTAKGLYAGGIVGLVEKNGADVQACYNTGRIESKGAAGAAGGITGENAKEADGFGASSYSAASQVSGSYNIGEVVAAKGAAGNITGRYFELNENCFALENNKTDRKYVTAVSKEQFASGELAYLLDGGGKQNRTTNWSQSGTIPVFADGDNTPIYKVSIGASGKGKLSAAEGGGSFSSKTSYLQKDERVSLTAVADSGYKLYRLVSSGAEITADGNNIAFAVPAADVSLVAVFAGIEVVEGSNIALFDACGGTFEDKASQATVIVAPGGKLSFPNEPKKDGFTFKGWFDAKSDGNKIAEGISIDKDVTYYAQWTRVEGSFTEGDGSEANPYIISTAEDMYLMAGKVNSGSEAYVDKWYKVKDEDTVFELSDDWEPIGTKSNPFMGTFDGNGALIRLNATSGLFGFIRESTIMNFQVGADVLGDSMVGGVASYFAGKRANVRETLTLENITVTGSVTGLSAVGGLLGGTDGNRYASSGSGSQGLDLVVIKNCRNAATIQNNGGYTGGLVGYLYADHEIYDSANTGNVSAGTDPSTFYGSASSAGGLAGWFIVGTVDRCMNSGRIEANGDGCGGLMGHTSYTTGGVRSINNSYNLGDVKSESGVGGIAGNYGSGTQNYSINNCYNYGKIETTMKKTAYGAISSDAGSKTYGCFTLEGAAGEKAADAAQVTTASAAQFKSGEIAYRLDGGGTATRAGIWTQDVKAGLPVPGTPSYYKLDVNGNEGKYTVTVTAADGNTFEMKDGEDAVFYAGGGDEPVKVAVKGGSETVTEGGKKYQITYKPTGIQLTQGDETKDILEGGTFTLLADSALAVTVEAASKEEVIKPDHGGSNHGSGNGNGSGSGTSGSGEGQGSGTEGTENGTGDGSGTASGDQQGTGDVPGNTTGGQKEQTPSKSTTVSSDNTGEKLPAAVETKPEETDQEDDEAIEAANSGGLEEGAQGSEEENEEQNVTVWEIVKKTVAENPIVAIAIIAAAAAIIAAGGISRFRKFKG